MSTPTDPILDSPREPELSLPRPDVLEAPVRLPAEDPPWSGWDVLVLALITLGAIFTFYFAIVYTLHRSLYPKLPLSEVAKAPELVVLAQALAGLVLFGSMYVIARRDPALSFATAVRWNWPRHWSFYLLAGSMLCLSLQLLARFLPIPRTLPMDDFFRSRHAAYLLSIYGVSVAPLLEEFFFRGFLYPVLARKLGVAVAIVVTALFFAGVHGAQLAYSWAPVLVIFMVGLALTAVRAVTKSLSASLLMHVAYNSTIMIMLFVATSGFRNLQLLNQ